MNLYKVQYKNIDGAPKDMLVFAEGMEINSKLIAFKVNGEIVKVVSGDVTIDLVQDPVTVFKAADWEALERIVKTHNKNQWG